MFFFIKSMLARKNIPTMWKTANGFRFQKPERNKKRSIAVLTLVMRNAQSLRESCVVTMVVFIGLF